MKEVKGIGLSIPSNNDDDYLPIDSFSSLSETDIAIFYPDINSTNYSTFNPNSIDGGKHEGKTLYNTESSTRIKEHIKHWKKELANFVTHGGTLIVPLCEVQKFYIYSGTRDVSGRGRSQKVTYHVTPVTNYDFLPFSFIEYHSSIGRNVFPKDPAYIDFHNHFKELLSFKTYLKSDKITNATFSTKKGDRILGTNFKLKEGYVIFLPDIVLYANEDVEYEEEDDYTSWTEEALREGKIFINCLVQIDKALRNDKAKSPKPEWVNNECFSLKKAVKTRSVIKKNKEEIEKRKQENQELLTVLEEQETLKDLLYETGKSLENAVTEALRILGYKAENYDDGELELDQIIQSPEGDRFIGECEGKDNKAIDVSKFRQLLDGLNADFEREEVDEKAYGLLFGNAQRLLNPDNRVHDFTNKCKSGANREKIGLITTVGLFKICKYLDENKDTRFAKRCRQAIKDQLGKVISFPEIPKKNAANKVESDHTAGM